MRSGADYSCFIASFKCTYHGHRPQPRNTRVAHNWGIELWVLLMPSLEGNRKNLVAPIQGQVGDTRGDVQAAVVLIVPVFDVRLSVSNGQGKGTNFSGGWFDVYAPDDLAHGVFRRVVKNNRQSFFLNDADLDFGFLGSILWRACWLCGASLRAFRGRIAAASSSSGKTRRIKGHTKRIRNVKYITLFSCCF